ncbi:thioredoxin family protein [Acidimangrovimonas sediminis]|uniref:thioredoxin family protein n=1 Tax=Acidimangrovimonas sediminis TaxID=2056283 RepID=UPI000C7FF3B8|nr:thioredoxin family protein [Acidimangrovimonas sediminis]
MSATPPVCDFGWKAPGFTLPATDGRTLSFDDVRGEKGTLIMFICNHCPYVQAVMDRIVRDAAALQALGIGVAAISSNDTQAYPQDGFAAMAAEAERQGFTFPYLFDESQDVARAYGAVCTPDFFGFDADGGLQYRGRLDASRKQAAAPDVRRDLYDAMRQVAETGHGPAEQVPSMGCSIKWRAA